MPGLHAKLPPSGSKRWLACTASPLYVEELRQAGTIEGDKDSVYSIEGTEAHDWASSLLLGKRTVDDIPEDFRPHVTEYERVCLECEEGADEQQSLRMVEQKVPLFYSPGETGTVDYGFLRVNAKGKAEALFIRDLKYGKGVPVDAEENTQLAIYAHSWILEIGSWWGAIPGHIPVSIGIHQPRYNGDDSLKLWDTTVAELAEFCKPILKTARAIVKAKSPDDLEFSPSADVCQFCPAKGICTARATHAFESFPADIIGLDLMSNLDIPAPDSLSLETLVAVWKHKKDITRWLENAEEYLTALATAGTPAEGTKLVAGRDGNRRWKDEKAAAEYLRPRTGSTDIWVTTLISPSQAEKALKAAAVDKKVIETQMVKLTERPAGKEVLALAEDKRDAVEPAIKHFEILTDEEEDV